MSETTFSRQTSLSFLKILNASHKDFHRCSVAVLTRKKQNSSEETATLPTVAKAEVWGTFPSPHFSFWLFPPPRSTVWIVFLNDEYKPKCVYYFLWDNKVQCPAGHVFYCWSCLWWSKSRAIYSYPFFSGSICVFSNIIVLLKLTKSLQSV